MTPKDAVIEKMARALLTETGWGIAEVDEVFLGPNYPVVAKIFRAYARAAYEAEHAAIDDEALDRGINAITENRVRAEAEHEEDGK